MRYIVLLIFLAVTQSVMAWGKKGHDVIAYIAECHLSERALERVTEVLDGRTMVYYSSWMDRASNTPKYSYSKPWHYFNMDRRESVAEAKRSKKGDLLSALNEIEKSLRSGELSKEQEKIALMMFIHLVGDMHQPMHLGEPDNEGGGTIPVVYFVESTNLHALWDYHLIEGVYSWSYTEWQIQIDRASDDEEAKITAGSYLDWLEETHEITKLAYRKTPAETRVFYSYIDEFRPIVEQQFLYAGLRLAYLLNSIYKDRSVR